MSFLAFELPRILNGEEAVDAEHCMQTLFNDDCANAFLVTANRREDARRMAFDEIYKDISLNEAMRIAQHEIKELSMEDNTEYIMYQYGMYDSQIILNIVDDMRIRTACAVESVEPTEINEKVYELSVESIKELCYESSAFGIGLIEVKKEVGKTQIRDEEEQQDNPFCD